MLKLVQHLVISNDGTIPEINGCLYAYILAGNGVFIRAIREGLDVLIPVSNFQVMGLPAVIPYVHLLERVPCAFLNQSVRLAQQALPNEALFWFNHKIVWQMNMPDQTAQSGRVVPLDSQDLIGTMALVDLHSHGTLSPFFSVTDNRDEQGFRIYAVMGNVDTAPSLLVRVGIYGHYWNIPASTVFEMPGHITDAWMGREEWPNETE